MNIKNYIKTGTLGILMLGAVSCDVVNLDPISTLTEANFYKTADDMNRAVIGIYSRYQARLPRDWAMFEMPTESLYMSAYRFIGGLEAVNTLNFEPQNDIFKGFWQNTYNIIFRANAVLDKIDTPTNYTGTQKNQYEGEARFMRALSYFELVRSFGGVPKIDRVISVQESRATGRATEQEIYDFIIADLKTAIEKLPVQSGTVYGRASKGAAVALLGKVYIYRKEWANAYNYLNQVDQYGYGLVDDYKTLWQIQFEDNKEAIFAIKYLEATNGQRLSVDFLPYFGVEGVSNSAGGEVALPGWSLHKKFLTTDSRKSATITEYWRNPGSTTALEWRPFISKFMAPNANVAGLDIPVIRYADVVLLKSEALYNLDRKDEALVELNKVRARAFKGTSQNYTMADISTPEKYLDVLLLERQLEFALENQRWFDLVRTDRFMTALAQVEWGYNPVTGTAQVVPQTPKPFFKLFPIPQHEIDQANPGVLKQNEGYSN